jgi:hypothetical protein
LLVPKACSGWISTVPVLTTDTALTGSGVLRSAPETAMAAFMVVPPEVSDISIDQAHAASVPSAPRFVSDLSSGVA